MSPVRVGEQARRQARRDAQFLIHLAQTDLAGSPEAATSIVERAVACEWWDVALLAEYAGVVAVTSGGDASGLGRAVDAVGTWAERCGDAASLALFHALRARAAAFLSDEVVSPATDNDLATASVLLERREGGAVERVTAHVECALLFGRRRFWELEAAQYDLALAVDVLAEDPGLDRRELQVVGARWAIANNLAEAGGHRMSGRYLIGDAAGLCHAAVDARRVIAEAVASGLPEAWLPEIDAVAVLVDALTGLDVVEAAVEVGERLEPGTPFEGMALLAGALAGRHRAPARSAETVEAAIVRLAGSDLEVEHELALLLAVELDADRAGTVTAGLRLARHHHRRDWDQRIANIHSMEALMEAARSQAERASLERDARFDELTGIANRRGYHRYLEAVERSPLRPVALLVVDVDRFKDINDQSGHDAGDRALRRVAGVISGQARTGDLAARMGGDEFVLILEGADGDAARSRAQQILSALGRRGRAGADYEAEIAVSIGIAVGATDQLEAMVRKADAALYAAKALGGRRAVVSGQPQPIGLPPSPR
jgi:diguanylate cyclase (GGDEF)-like protein